MRMYYCEDRSTGLSGKDASPKVCNILQLIELTDWTAEGIDEVLDLDVSEECMIDSWIYVKRLV